MIPVLLDLKVFRLYTFGVFLVLAFFWGCFLLWKNIRLTSYKEEDIFDGLFLSIGGGLFVSRLVYVILNFNDFGFNILKFILINGYPGLSLYGFVAGALIVFSLYFRSKKTSTLDALNYFVPPAFLALAIGRMGNFISSARWTNIGESLLFFLGSFVTYKIMLTLRRGKYPAGFNLYVFAWYLGLVSIVFESKIFSFNGIISVLLLLTFSFYFLYYFRSLLVKGLKKYGTHHQFRVHKKTESEAHERAGDSTQADS